jgi:hypothetical protein
MKGRLCGTTISGGYNKVGCRRAGHLEGRARSVEGGGGGKVVDAAGEPDRLG